MTREMGVMLVGALLGCGAAEPCSATPTTVETPNEGPSSVAPGSADSEETATAAARPPTGAEQRLDGDLQTALGGSFAVDQIGPDAMAATLARFRERAGDYLDRFEALYFVRAGSSMAPIPVHVRSEIFLGHLYLHAPDRVRQIARRHVLIDREALRDARLVDDARGAAAIRDRALTRLAEGVDVPMGARWTTIQPDGWCLDAAPVLGTIVRVWSDCTCGEAMACAADLRGGRLEVRARFDPDSPAICDDCYPTHAGCRLPALPRVTTVSITIEGRAAGSIDTDSDGAPVAFPPCP